MIETIQKRKINFNNSEEIVNAVVESVYVFFGNREQTDDLTLLALVRLE